MKILPDRRRFAAIVTVLAVTLGSQLEPGDCTMSLELADPHTGVTASVLDVPLSVAAPELFEQATEFFAPITNLAPPGFTPLRSLQPRHRSEN